MGFFEKIATALDNDGIESRVNGDTMFVPITSDLEIQFVEIDSLLPAANVYIAAANVDEDDEDFDAVLVSVVFSVEDAVSAVASHVATDQQITVLRDLLEGTDERITDLEFFQDPSDPNLVRTAVGRNSELQVLVEVEDGVPTASVTFIALGESMEKLIDQALDESQDLDDSSTLSEEERLTLFYDVSTELEFGSEEVLELGVFTDFDKLFDVLSLADDHAEDWEDELAPLEEDLLDEPDVYDIFIDDNDEYDEDIFDDDDSAGDNPADPAFGAVEQDQGQD